MAKRIKKNEEDFIRAMEAQREQILKADDFDPMAQAQMVYQLSWRWADFELTVISPSLKTISPPQVLMPEPISGTDELEFVYPIVDHGFKFSFSKGEEMFSSGLSMCKSHFTIEKIITLLIERLDAEGNDAQAETLVALGGHELLQRKCFEVVINLSKHNLVVTNFDPGAWGEEYLLRVKRLVALGYGYPSEAPRTIYRQGHHVSPGKSQ